MGFLKYKDQLGQWKELKAITGKSAYSAAVDGGFSGTEEEFSQNMASFADKADKSANSTISLTSAGWNNKSQTVSVSGVTSNNNIMVSPANRSSAEIWGDCEVMCVAQSNGSLTFTCSDAPTQNISVSVVILG